MAAIDFQRMFYALHTPYMVLDRRMCFIDMNDRYLVVTTRTREDLIGKYVFTAFPESEERVTRFKEAFASALAGTANSLVREKFAIPVPAEDGGGMREVWWTCHHIPVYDTNGEVCGMVQHADDVTAEVLGERMREAVSQEFSHRIKNLLSTISVVARRTAMAAPSTEAFIAVFGQRIDAMARTHDMLARAGWEGMQLRDLIEKELDAFRHGGHGGIEVEGPDVNLSGAEAQALGMAFHELATNAAKYGAFSVPDGQLSVSWTMTDGRLEIVWRESGLSGVRAPERAGFGSRIIDEVMPMQLDGEVERVFEPTGMRCIISVPHG